MKHSRGSGICDSSRWIRIPDLVRPLTNFYPAAYQAVFHGDVIACPTTGTVFDSFPPPTAIIMDFFSIVQLQQTRAISGTAIPVFAFASCGSAALLRLFGPESLGGLGDFGARTDAEALRTGKSSVDIGDQILKHTEGSIIRIPGLPAMYDYEFFPQELPRNVPITPFFSSMFMQCDGVFVNTCEAYDSVRDGPSASGIMRGSIAETTDAVIRSSQLTLPQAPAARSCRCRRYSRLVAVLVDPLV
ncbi:hypothetical protein B0H13DRAFT_2363146 [Mycena leptocephala]|nr:hypothetical protein B0H13DRAFT_2363146 [Mycena leptocephala]